jgi:hypothetical protein
MVNMAFARRGHLVVAVHSSTPPSNDEWNAYLVFCAGLVDEYRKSDVLPFSIVFTDGAAPGAGQRRSFLDVVGKRPFVCSIVTNSAATRGVVTLLSWFAPGVRAFSPADVDGVLDHCGPGRAILGDVLALTSPLAAACNGIGVFDRFVAASTAEKKRSLRA